MNVKTAGTHPRLRMLSGLGTLLLAMMGTVACGPTAAPEEQYPELQRGQGLALTLRVDKDTDVTAIRFKIDRRKCSTEPFEPFSVTVDKPLEEIRIPWGIPGLEDNPLDAHSSHLFADLFYTLDAGCYDVSTQPLNAQGTASKDCAAASESGVWVKDGLTTEVLLINQCTSGPERGGIDIISALNHAPELVEVAFQDSKFVYQCADQVICATFKDPDYDPLEFVWSLVDGPAALHVAPTVLSTKTNPDRSITQCVRTVAEAPGRYTLKVTAYDLLHEGGKLIRIEDYLAAHGTSLPSNDSLTFPFYAASDGRTGGCDTVTVP